METVSDDPLFFIETITDFDADIERRRFRREGSHPQRIAEDVPESYEQIVVPTSFSLLNVAPNEVDDAGDGASTTIHIAMRCMCRASDCHICLMGKRWVHSVIPTTGHNDERYYTACAFPPVTLTRTNNGSVVEYLEEVGPAGYVPICMMGELGCQTEWRSLRTCLISILKSWMMMCRAADGTTGIGGFLRRMRHVAMDSTVEDFINRHFLVTLDPGTNDYSVVTINRDRLYDAKSTERDTRRMELFLAQRVLPNLLTVKQRKGSSSSSSGRRRIASTAVSSGADGVALTSACPLVRSAPGVSDDVDTEADVPRKRLRVSSFTPPPPYKKCLYWCREPKYPSSTAWLPRLPSLHNGCVAQYMTSKSTRSTPHSWPQLPPPRLARHGDLFADIIQELIDSIP